MLYTKFSVQSYSSKFNKNDIFFVALFCPNIPPIKNGNIYCTKGVRHGSTCTFTCNEGFALNPPNHSGMLCYKKSEWIGTSVPTCRKLCKIKEISFSNFVRLNRLILLVYDSPQN